MKRPRPGGEVAARGVPRDTNLILYSVRSDTDLPATSPTSRAARLRFLFASLGALLLFAAAYSNSLTNAFHFDDGHVIEQNLFIRDLANVPRFFTDARTFSALPQNQTYRPLLSASLAIDYALAHGLDPVMYHVTQLLLFAAVGVLLALFYRRALDSTGARHAWVALVAATLFCVHTGNTQTGNYISARSELLSGLGVLGGLLLYLHAPSRRWFLYLLPVVAGALAKNLAVMFAPLLLVYKLLIEEQLAIDEIFTRRAWPRVRSALASTIPAFVVCAALFVFVESMNPPGQTYGGGGRVSYLVTQAWVWVRYAGLYILPVGLTADTDLRPFASAADVRVLAGVALLALSLVLAWVASRGRNGRPVAFGILWYWIALFPTSSIFPLAEVTNDHRVFFPFMGLNLAAVWSVAMLFERRRDMTDAVGAARIGRVAASLAMVVLAAHAIGTFTRNRVWRTDETLWSDVVRKSPGNGRALMNYGLSFMRRGQLAEARDMFTRAQRLAPNYSYLEVNLGVVNGALGDQAQADAHFRRAVALAPDQPTVHRFHGRWLVEQGRGREALDAYRRVIALSPGDVDARQALMRLYAAAGDSASLRDLATETLGLVRNDTLARTYAAGGVPLAPAAPTGDAWFALGLRLTRDGQHVDAAQAYRRAVAADPRNADAWNNLGWTLAKLGFFTDAIPALERAVALRPGYQLARNNLAWARAEAARRQS